MAALKFPQRCQSKRGKKEALAERMRRVSEAARGRPWRPGTLAGTGRGALVSPGGARRGAEGSVPARPCLPWRGCMPARAVLCQVPFCTSQRQPSVSAASRVRARRAGDRPRPPAAARPSGQPRRAAAGAGGCLLRARRRPRRAMSTARAPGARFSARLRPGSRTVTVGRKGARLGCRGGLGGGGGGTEGVEVRSQHHEQSPCLE